MLIAFGGAVSLVAAVVVYVMGRQRLLLVSGGTAAGAMVAWIAFAATGSI